MYDAYKPFRNYLRQFPLVQSLQYVWLLAEHLESKAKLPPALHPPSGPFGQSTDLKGMVYAWDLDVLAREIVLNAAATGSRSLGRYDDLATALNHIRALEDAAFDVFSDEGGDVIRELHRIIHRQFPWQRPPTRLSLMRYMRIFARADVAPLVEAETGLTMKQLYQLALAIRGHFLTQAGMSTNQDYAVLGLERAASEGFVRRLTTTVPELRQATIAQQHYDGRWLYAWNPLHAKPLVSFDPKHPDRVICPLPSLLLRRVSEGLFYDLSSIPGFGDVFGRSFQAYVGEVLSLVCPPPRFHLAGEQEYRVGKNRKDGVDWILEDDGAVLFIECKASRLRLDAKIGSDTVALEAALDRLAGAIVQHYKNVADALAGRTAWEPSSKPSYPLLVTLEDWWVFGSVVFGLLEQSVRRQLSEANLDPDLIETMPFTIASAGELEVALHAIAEVGVLKFLKEKTEGEHRGWAISPFSSQAYPSAERRARRMQLDDAWSELVPQET